MGKKSSHHQFVPGPVRRVLRSTRRRMLLLRQAEGWLLTLAVAAGALAAAMALDWLLVLIDTRARVALTGVAGLVMTYSWFFLSKRPYSILNLRMVVTKIKYYFICAFMGCGERGKPV